MSTPFDPNNPQNRPQPPYQGPPQGPPPGYQPQQPMTAQQARANVKGAKAQAKAMRPWFKKKRFLFPIGLVLLLSIIGIATSGTNGAPTAAVPAGGAETSTAPDGAPPTKASDKTKAKASEPTMPKIGDKASAGDWDFKITKFKCGASKVGDEYLNKKAQGQFCMMNLSVTNNSDTAEFLTDSNQKILDKKGRTFSSDSEASIYADSSNNLLSEEINPGNTAKGLIVFDIPKGAKPETASLAGGIFGVSDVVTIDLT